MRLSIGLVVVLVLVLAAGCSASTTLEIDGGIVGSDTGGSVDTGVTRTDAFVGDDAFAPRVDAGRDAAAPADVGSVLPPRDGGSPFGDSGALGDPAWVPLTVLTDGSMCRPLVPCGGNIVGTWDVSGGCVAIDLSAVMRCPGATVSGSGQSRGRVTFDGMVAHRAAQTEVDVQLYVPAVCARFVGGCAALEAQIRMGQPDSACVMATDGSCNCQVRNISAINQTDGYTTRNNEIIGTASGKTWAYCVSGTTLSYEDNSPMGMREPGIISLTMR